MMGTTAAILGGGLISAGSQWLGGNKAAKAQQAAASQLRHDIQDQQTKNAGYLAPYMTAGTNALKTYQDALGLNGADAQKAYYSSFQTDPGWEQANQAGINAVSNKYSLSGANGGNKLAALYEFGQRNMLSAYNSRLEQINGLVNTGMSATNTLVGANSNLSSAGATGSATLLSAAGQSQGAGIAGAGKALGGTLGALGNYNMYNTALNNGLLNYTPGTTANGGWSTLTTRLGNGNWVQ